MKMKDKRMITYSKVKVDLNAYYDKPIIMEDGIHIKPLW